MSKEVVTSLPQSSDITISYPTGGETGHDFYKSPETPLCPPWVRTPKFFPRVNKEPLMLRRKRQLALAFTLLSQG